MVELAPRSRFGVSVLAVQKARIESDDGFIPISPDRKLGAGDTIMAAGRPSDLRRFMRAARTAVSLADSLTDCASR